MHCFSVKNITLSADAALIEQARKRASNESKSLNELFRDWLKTYVSQPLAGERFDAIHDSLMHVRPSKRFTRDELNER